MIASSRRIAKIRELDTPREPTVHELLAELDACDWVLVEGFKHADLLKIEVWRDSVGKRAQYPDDPYIVAIATDDRDPAAAAHRPACIRTRRCGCDRPIPARQLSSL